jgi:hypothetical protein
MLAVAIAGIGLYASVAIRYRLGTEDWVAAAIALAFLGSFILAGNVLLRRPGVAVPGLLGGLFVAVAWLATSGFTFYRFITSITAAWAIPLLHMVVPNRASSCCCARQWHVPLAAATWLSGLS